MSQGLNSRKLDDGDDDDDDDADADDYDDDADADDYDDEYDDYYRICSRNLRPRVFCAP